MEIIVSQENGAVPVSVLHMKGDLDASSYLELVNTAQMLYDEGVRYLVLDLTDLAFISSAGLASLHIVTKLFRGEETDLEDGWGTFRDMGRERDSGFQKNVKLLSPSPNVDKVLDTVGFKQSFEVFASLADAVRSFS